jgi:hypothetical protein
MFSKPAAFDVVAARMCCSHDTPLSASALLHLSNSLVNTLIGFASPILKVE